MTSVWPESPPGDYVPVDLAAVCNHAGQVPGAPAPTGDLRFHGLPFRIGNPIRPGAPQFVLLAPGEPPAHVAVSGRPRTVVVAHRLLPDGADFAAATGAVMARYDFRFADGSVATADIRRRFEIDRCPAEGWDFDVPFAARLSSTPALPDRHEGLWERLGDRLSEATLSLPPSYLLWTWVNQREDTDLVQLTFRSVAGRVLVAGVTLGHVDEDPFARTAALPVLVDVAGTVNGPVAVAVDRGTASYTQPRVEGGQHGLTVPGFGAVPLSGTGFRGYAHVSATPSATLSVTAGDECLGAVRWSALAADGRAAVGPIQVTLRDPGRTWARFVVSDEETGAPVPCRIHVRSQDGVPFPPYGHVESVARGLGRPGDVRLDAITYAYIDGTCEGWLPRGRVEIEVARGFEYEPLHTQVTVTDETTHVALSLSRWTSMNRRGWYSGDTHAHFLSAAGSVFEQQAEDLNVVNLLATQWGGLFTGFEEFTGEPLRAKAGPYLTHVSQENRQHLLGHLVLLGLQSQVLPACTDGPPEATLGAALEATMSDWADRCHDQGGTVIVPHVPRPNGELAALVATGRADGFEMIVQHPDAHAEYYRYLNCGYRMPLVGGTDKMSAEVPVGLYRTYVHLGDEDFSYAAWCRALKAGRTFLTGGPLLDFTVDSRIPGETVSLASPGHVSVRARVESALPVETLQIVQDGVVVAEVNHPGGTRTLALDESLPAGASGWFAARCGGPGYFNGTRHHDVWQRGVFAHTSPVYVTVGADWSMFDPAVARYLLAMLEGGLSYVRDRATPHGPSTTHYHGQPNHLAYLERPFRDAMDLVRRRLEERR